jgi:hypothetical protein
MELQKRQSSIILAPDRKDDAEVSREATEAA